METIKCSLPRNVCGYGKLEQRTSKQGRAGGPPSLHFRFSGIHFVYFQKSKVVISRPCPSFPHAQIAIIFRFLALAYLTVYAVPPVDFLKKQTHRALVSTSLWFRLNIQPLLGLNQASGLAGGYDSLLMHFYPVKVCSRITFAVYHRLPGCR